MREKVSHPYSPAFKSGRKCMGGQGYTRALGSGSFDREGGLSIRR